MFREMRRRKQALDSAACRTILERGSCGVLALSGDGGYPYAVPLSYAYAEGKIYFHSAVEGHKIDAIARDARASFCVVDADDVVPEEYSTNYRSAIAFGRARVLTGEAARPGLLALSRKYCPGQDPKAEIDGALSRVAVIELEIEALSGKESRALANARAARAD